MLLKTWGTVTLTINNILTTKHKIMHDLEIIECYKFCFS